MRIPKVHDLRLEKSKEKTKYDYETVTVDLRPSEYVDDLGLFENEKELHRFVVRTKFYIRKSLEYSELMKFLKRYHGMYCCGIHQNVNMYDGFPINIHHTPLVMEDIIYIVINKRLKLGESMKMSSIGREIMQLHYLGLIGLYPLCESCHELCHSDNNDLFIPLDAIFGEPEAFFEIYKDFITSTMQEKLRTIQELNKGFNIIQREIPDTVIRKYIYVQEKGAEVVSTSKLYNFIVELNSD